jgi:phage tail protein X
MPRTYTTRDGDMYDLISYRMYGSEYHLDTIIDANPLYYDVLHFDDGCDLLIPDLPSPATIGGPPWIALGP